MRPILLIVLLLGQAGATGVSRPAIATGVRAC